MKAKLFYTLAAFALIFAGCETGTTPPPTSGDKTVSVAAQTGTLTAGSAGTATFEVSTTNIADGIAGSVSWFVDAAGATAGTTPAGIQVSQFETAANKATVTMTATDQTVEGDYRFKVTIDGTTSAVATLKVNAAEILPLGLPSNPIVAGKTTTTASLKWDAADNAESYIVRLNGTTTYPAAVLTYTANNLTPGTAYTWEVASVRGDDQSAWVAGEGFTTETAIPEKDLYLYGADFYIESSLGHLLLYLLDYDPDGNDQNGMQICLRIKCDLDDMDFDPTKKFVDLPAGTYNVVDSDDTPYSIQIHGGTVLRPCTDGSPDYDNSHAITGGSMIVSGDETDGYFIKFDLTHSGGTYSVQGQCPAFEIYNPDFGKPGRITNGNMGDLTYLTVAYFPKPYEEEIDIFLTRGVGSSGITFDYSDYRYPKGTGYYVRAIEMSTALNSNYIADGVYTIRSACNNPGDVLGGYDNVNGGRSGFYVERYENDVLVAASPLVSGTVTVTSLAVGYRLELNAKDDKGTDFTATITAAN